MGTHGARRCIDCSSARLLERIVCFDSLDSDVDLGMTTHLMLQLEARVEPTNEHTINDVHKAHLMDQSCTYKWWIDEPCVHMMSGGSIMYTRLHKAHVHMSGGSMSLVYT